MHRTNARSRLWSHAGTRLALASAALPWAATLGCELVIGDETRVVADSGDAAMPDAGGPPDVPDPQPAAKPDAGGAAQACIEMATTCNELCVPQSDCIGNPPGKGCAEEVAVC